MSKLIDLFYTLEKSSIKWNTYFDVYERHLSKFVGKSPKILEIGVLDGGSIELWLKYFGKDTTIVGLDINPKNFTYDGNVTFEQGDQGDHDFWDSFLSRHGTFDIVIDDGGHTMHQQNTTLHKVFPSINEGGVVIIEDTHTSYWADWGGIPTSPTTFLNNSKKLTDVVNRHHFKGEVLDNDTLNNFADLYSVSFYNSVVVFEKRKEESFVCLKSK